MKTSLKKLQKFAAQKIEKRGQKKHQPLAQDELARATQDMNEMRECYDRLLAAAAATANSVYEISESLKEMGGCLLEKTSFNDDEGSGKLLLRLGRAQFELQKLADKYRSHISQTVTIPSESLLNELHIVEEMKKGCDGKREIYEDLMKKQKEKGRSRSSKGELLQLQAALDEYDEEANVFVFRMKSLKQGQTRSLLTQGSRHYAAQLCFFKKAVRSLEAIEPHVRLVAEQQHIDYQFSGIRDFDMDIYEDVDGGDDDDDDESDSGGYYDTVDGSEAHDDTKVCGDNGLNLPEQETSKMKTSMELDGIDSAHSTNPKPGVAKENLPSLRRNSFSFQEVRRISKSAPLFPEKKLDSNELLLTKMRPSPSRKFTSYALPTPNETKSPTFAKIEKDVPQPMEAISNLWHSSSLDLNQHKKHQTTDKVSGPIILDAQSVLKESNNSKPASKLPPPLRQNLSFRHSDPNIASYAKKVKRQAFSGPLSADPWPENPSVDPTVSSGCPPPISLSLLRAPLPRPINVPRRLSSTNILPPFVSSPKISELHELPRPPLHLAASGPRATHSGPLSSKSQEMSPSQVSLTSTVAVLPRPPPILPRSHTFSARGLPEGALDGIYSPRLAPVSLPDVRSTSPTSR